MKIAAVLPHVEVFGGVRRYIELGNALTARGHDFSLFHPEGTPPEWLSFSGRTLPFSALTGDRFDVALCSEYSILPAFESLQAGRKYFYFVLEGHKQERQVARSGYRFLGNSEGICHRIERKYGVRCFKAAGGVNFDLFHPPEDRESRRRFSILSYGRIYKKRKGVAIVLRAVRDLHRKHSRVRLILFDSLVGKDRRDPRPMIRTTVPLTFHLGLPQDKMVELYGQAEVFVSAERRAGWSNTTAEAMACGVPVVCTPSGTKDFAIHGVTALVVPYAHPRLIRRQIERLLNDPALGERLSRAALKKIREFSWSSLAERLERHFRSGAN